MKKYIFFFLLIAMLLVCLKPTITSILFAPKGSDEVRNGLIGSWQLTGRIDGASYLGADGKVFSFDKYLLYKSNKIIPYQYKIRFVPYNRKKDLYVKFPAIVLSSRDNNREWLDDSYVITYNDAYTLKLVPTLMIIGSKRPKEYTFIRIKDPQ